MSEESEQTIDQYPIDTTKAGIYEWTMKLSGSTVTGHVVVRGTDADPIGNYQWPQGTEVWFQQSDSSGQTSPATFFIQLDRLDDPDDQDLVDAVDDIVQNETLIGTADMVIDWQKGAPLGDDPLVFTLQEISKGVQGHDYSWLYEHISFQMPVGKAPELPTWYTDDTDIKSVFGGDPEQSVPIVEGITAKFVEVGSGDDGYPGEGWHWFGRDPE